MLASLLTFLSTHKMPDIVFREITGNNIPHVAIVRNKDEFIDQSMSQFGNTAAYFGTGLVMDKLLNFVPKLFKAPFTPISHAWFKLGKSLSIFSLIAAVNLAMPFLRNYITTQRTHTSNYIEMIGEKAKQKESPESLQKTLNGYKNRFLRTVAIGAATSVTLLVGTLGFIKGKVQMPQALQFINKHVGLAEGKFKNFSPLSAVLFWVIPTYSGLLAGARDKYEMKELALRFAAFNLAFFVFPYTVERGIDRLVRNMKPTKLLGPAKNIAYLGKFFSSLLFCSAVPTVLNIYLTRQRVRRDGLNKSQQMPPQQRPLARPVMQPHPIITIPVQRISPSVFPSKPFSTASNGFFLPISSAQGLNFRGECENIKVRTYAKGIPE